MTVLLKTIKWLLILIGVFVVVALANLEANHGLITKLIKAPSFHERAIPTYITMAKRLLESGDITHASIRKVAVADNVTNEEIEEAMSSVAIERGIREVGTLPLSEQVEIQLKESDNVNYKQRFLKIYQYCSPRIAMQMTGYSESFSAYLPCRIALVEDKKGKRWLFTLDMDLMIYGGKPLPEKLHKKALEVQQTIYAIMDRGAKGDF